MNPTLVDRVLTTMPAKEFFRRLIEVPTLQAQQNPVTAFFEELRGAGIYGSPVGSAGYTALMRQAAFYRGK